MKETYPTLNSKQQRRELSYCARLCFIDVSKRHLQPSAVKSIRGHRVRPCYTRNFARYLFHPRIQARTLNCHKSTDSCVLSRTGNKVNTHVWLSPFGLKIHAHRLAETTKMRPIKMLQLQPVFHELALIQFLCFYPVVLSSPTGVAGHTHSPWYLQSPVSVIVHNICVMRWRGVDHEAIGESETVTE